MVGSWSDLYGRKPFLVVGFFTALLPVSVVSLHLTFPGLVSLYLYYPASVSFIVRIFTSETLHASSRSCISSARTTVCWRASTQHATLLQQKLCAAILPEQGLHAAKQLQLLLLGLACSQCSRQMP